jgi:predicted hydrocarbon binding protein
MSPVNSRPPELALPVVALAAIRRELALSVGGDAAARALQTAGDAAGDAFYRALVHGFGSLGGETDPETAAHDRLAELDQTVFWRRFAELFSTRGWGHITMAPIHPGVAALDAADWVEADPEAGATRPSCFFTTGLLARVLGHVAGDQVAVLEAECRSCGDARCRFLFGSADALDEVFRQLSEGQPLDASLAALV